MVYPGFLRIGGTEIVNTERARGYTETTDCPKWLLQDAHPCESLQDALGDEAYNFVNIPQAPWYDLSLPDVSSRFYGVVGLGFRNLLDSSRSATLTEGTSAGGTIGRMRKGAKQPRVRATLLARGDDAMEYGLAWLNSAFDGNCSQHGDACGVTDMEFLSDCPPARGTVPEFTDWSAQEMNYVPNPSMETAGAAYEVRRNIYNETGRAGLISTFTPGISFLGSTWTRITPNDAVTGRGARFNVPLASLTNGATYRFAIEVANENGVPLTVALNWNDVTPVPFVIPAGGRQVIGINATRATYDSTWRFGDLRITSVTQQPVLYRVVGIERTTLPLAPFNGAENLAPDADLTPSWVGAANASDSILSAFRVSGANASMSLASVYQTSDWAESGTKSAKVVPNGDGNSSYGSFIVGGLTAFQTYTAIMTVQLDGPQSGSLNPTWQRQIMAQSAGMPVNNVLSNRAPNEAGETEVRVTFTLGNATAATIFMMNGSTSTPVRFDNFGVFPGEYVGEWFSGSTVPEDAELERFSWLSAANASLSLREIRSETTRPETDDEYFPKVDGLRRFMHEVSVTSGPLIIDERRSSDGIFRVMTVEWTISAERPWIYSLTRPVQLPVTPTTVLQDTPYNLVPRPSAELVDGTVAIATNYSLNPSLETNATGWVATSAAVTGTDPASRVTSGRVTGELQAVGTSSFRARLLGDGAAASGRARVNIYQTVDISTRVAGSRVSATLWGALLSVGPATALHSLVGAIEWYTAADALVSSTPLVGGTGGLGGNVFSAKSLVVPATATKARALLTAEFDWASGGTNSDVRMYGDALAITVP